MCRSRVADDRNSDLITYSDSDTWQLHWIVDTYGDSAEGREWQRGNYRACLTVTDFITEESITSSTRVTLT